MAQANSFQKPKVPTIDWATASKDTTDPRLFLVNTSGQIAFITVPIPGSETKVLRMPSTWIPVDMAVAADREYILKSSGFRSMASAGEIHIVPTQAALDLYENNHLVKLELQRLKVASGTGDIELNSEMPSVNHVPQEVAAVPGMPAQAQEQVNPRVADLVLKTNEGASTEDSTIGLLLNVVLTDTDIRYISANANSEKVRQFAAAQRV